MSNANEFVKQKRKSTWPAWDKAHPGKVKADRQKWVQANRDKLRAYWRQWRDANPDKMTAKRERDKDASAERTRRWYKANVERAKIFGREYRQKLMEEALHNLGNRCACLDCGISERLFLTIDHIHGLAEGEKRGTSSIFTAKKSGWDKSKFQVLCYNCNFAKRKGTNCPVHQPDAEPLNMRRLKSEALRFLGDICTCLGCGVTEPRFLTVDHIAGRDPGPKHHPAKEAEESGWDKTRFQILCFNCNAAKGRTHACPVHQKNKG